jgi:hypothetical protein
MKSRLLILSVFLLISKICLGQIAISELRLINNTPEFKGGEKALSIHFKKSLRNPMALEKKPGVCTILGFIKVAKNGKVKEAGTINKVPQPFKEEFIRVAKMTTGRWKATNDTSDYFYVVIPIGFSYAGLNYRGNLDGVPKFFIEPITVINFADTPVNEFITDSKYLEKLKELVFGKEYLPAVEIMDYLLSRQPLNTDYYRIMIELQKVLGMKEQVEYYSTLLDIMIEKN